jgi:hypothetical protein
MATFAEMITAVTDITKRPELVTLTKQAVRQATLRAHHTDFFPRDRDSAVLTYTPSSTASFIDIPGIYAAIPQLRTPEFLQSEDVSTQAPTENLEFLNSFKDFWDDQGIRKLSVFTQQGESLRCSFASATGRARLWYYLNPVVSDAAYSSWIANAHIEEVAQWAAGIIWARTGFTEQASQAQTSVEAFKADLQSSYLMNKI